MLTGDQYKESLRDGRTVYFEGRLVEDFGSEPALAVPLQAMADGYDKYYSAEPGAVNPLTIAPRSPEELRDRIPVITEMDLLLNVTYQSLMTLLVAAARLEDHAPGFVPRIRATADALGGWHQVTNLQAGGGLFAQRLVTRKHYDIERARALALKAAGLSGA